MSLYVQKYGGTSVGTLERIKSVAAHIAATYRAGHQLVVAVSAMGQQTDELLEMALQISPQPPQREVDMLLTVGERITMSLLSIALNDLAIATVSLTGSQSGILTDNMFGNAKINRILGDRIRRALDENKVVIVAGFQGMSEQEKEITTLGRGGTDLTAIALAHALKADRCQIYKDVDGVCSADPRFVPTARVLGELSWDALSNLTWYGSGVVHNRGVHIAKKFKIPLEIRSSFNLETPGTMIGSAKSVEKALVHALTHRKDMMWLSLDLCDASKIPELLSYLYSQGEHPVYVQQNSAEDDVKWIEIVIHQQMSQKFERFVAQTLPGIKIRILHQGLTCITAVGDGFWQEPQLIQKALDALATPVVLFDCKNSVMNMFVQGGDLEGMLGHLHQALIEEA